MPNFILTSNATTTQTLTDSNDVYFLSQDVSHIVVGADVLTVDANRFGFDISVLGTMAQIGGGGAVFNGIGKSGNGFNISISATGSMIAGQNASAINFEADDSIIANHGYVEAGVAVRSTGRDLLLVNSGTISQTFPSNSFDVFAIRLEGFGNQLTNSGLITGRNTIETIRTAVVHNSGEILAFERAISMDELSVDRSDPMTLVNDGLITGLEFAYFGGDLSDDLITNTGTINGVVRLGEGVSDITNTGTMTGAVSFGGDADRFITSGQVSGVVMLGDGADRLVNTGTMLGDITLGPGNDTLKTGGDLSGDVDAGDGADTVVNTGTITGEVALGSGADHFTNAVTGGVSGEVDGGAGNDTLFGGNLGDNLLGGDDNDLIAGRAGDDTLFGGRGNDTINGGSGNDELRGVLGQNVMNGENGNDVLFGGVEADRIFGGSGDDTLRAGTGADLLRGDAGADVFEFASVAETGSGGTRDRILGWEDGADLIDLSGFGALTFSSAGAIGGGTASIWFDAVSGGAQTMLRIDVDGNGSVDGQLLLVRADPSLFDQADLILA
ncbi:MAG: calcium-binding protein [Pseudomonadota bacterium]